MNTYSLLQIICIVMQLTCLITEIVVKDKYLKGIFMLAALILMVGAFTMGGISAILNSL